MRINSQTPDAGSIEVELPRSPISSNNLEVLKPYGDVIVTDYREFKRDFLEWLLIEGKNTYKKKGYSNSTVEHTHYKVDEAYRWKWQREDEYTTEFTIRNATELIEFLVRMTPHPGRYVYNFEKALRRLFNFEKALRRLFKFLRDERGRDIAEWEHDIPIERSEGSLDHIKDKFYPQEMNALYEAALKKFSIPNLYSESLSAEERDELKILLSQRNGVPKETIDRETFNNASSWKIASIIAVTADTGLRPIEIGQAKVDWFDVGRKEMVVPAEEATKNKEYWNCNLSSKAVNAVQQWVNERESYNLYHDEAGMWLTRYGNPYKARSLNRILNDLMDRAGISMRNRKLSWYSFRHGAATAWIEQEGLSRAKEQLRHKSIKTTQKYKREDGNSQGGVAGYW